MICAVIPVQNEAKNIASVISTLLLLPVNIVLPVINGSTDGSGEIIARCLSDRVCPIWFKESLGIDVPRAVGAAHARELGVKTLLFVDGDMVGDIGKALLALSEAIEAGGADMALTDCYPADEFVPLSTQALQLCQIRELFNRAVGLGYLRAASPAHGPHAVSRRLLDRLPLRELAVPPVTLAMAAQAGLKVVIGAQMPHCTLGSPDKGEEHARHIRHTIVGDYLEAFGVYRNTTRSRSLNGIVFDGYNHIRQFKVLDEYLKNSK